MENAVDALKIAFAVMVFTMALTLAISTFSQARETSEAILYMNDKTNYYSWEDEVNYSNDKRIVGIDAIIPTLYRYYKENYTVIFENSDGSKLPVYYLDSTKKWDKDNTGSEDDAINYFDLNSEITANCPWVGTVNDIKKNLDLFLKGTSGLSPENKSFGNINRTVKYEYGSGLKGFIKEYANATFLEQLGEYSTNRSYGIETDASEQKWLVIDGIGKYRYDSSNGMVDTNNDGTGDKKINVFLEENNLEIDPDATTFYDEESGEIIELAKPTIKRVIKYTLIENNP